MRHARLLFAISGPVLLLAGCKAGPDYKGPPQAGSAAVARGTFVRASDPALATTPGLARWWEGLNDPLLDALIDEALANSPNIDAAQARIREAAAKLQQGKSQLLPSLSVSPMAAHVELPGTSLTGEDGGTSFSIYNLGATVSWEPDIFGGKHRQVEAAHGAVEQRYADLADAQVSLSAQVAQSYVNLRDTQERVRLTTKAIELQGKALDLVRQRFEAGTASQLQVENFQNKIASARAQLVPLVAQSAIYKDALAVLTGRAPGELDERLAAAAPVPLPPAQVSIGDPAALIAHRPDVRSAERALAASTANVGIKQAARMPSVKFTGILGLGGTSPGDMFDPSKFAGILLPQLSWPLLDFGRSKGAVREAEAQRDAADAQYRQKVLQALQDAEDNLARFGATRLQLGRLLEAEQAAARATALNRQRYEAGTSTLVDQFDIELQRVQASTSVAQARAQLTIDFIAVNKALGLGWSDKIAAPVTSQKVRN